MENEIQSYNNGTTVTTDFSKFEEYLVSLKLPTENIIASPQERNLIMDALPKFILSLPEENRKDARYLSKFIAGAAVGLFDASLNFVWNEVVINLRRKVIIYGLDLFFDEAVGGKNRDNFSTEEDLAGIKDRTLLDTCLKLELISELVHKKLVHILDMRNDIGSSHPNQYSINSYELLGWLQTCINEVIKEEASKSSITVRQIIDNVKRSTSKFNKDYIAQFETSIKEVSKVLIGNLLTTLFNLFISNKTDSIVKQNISLLVPIVWNEALDSKKYSLGIQIANFKANLDAEKVKNAELFFDICDGKRYLTESDRIVTLSELSENLQQTHYAWDNYYNEVPIARDIMAFIKKSEDIPEAIEVKLIEAFLTCRIGREVSWHHGISPNGLKYYNHFFELLNQNQVILVLKSIIKPEFSSCFYGSIRTENFKNLLEMIKEKIPLTERIKDVIDFLLSEPDISNIAHSKKFSELSKGIIL